MSPGIPPSKTKNHYNSDFKLSCRLWSFWALISSFLVFFSGNTSYTIILGFTSILITLLLSNFKRLNGFSLSFNQKTIALISFSFIFTIMISVSFMEMTSKGTVTTVAPLPEKYENNQINVTSPSDDVEYRNSQINVTSQKIETKSIKACAGISLSHDERDGTITITNSITKIQQENLKSSQKLSHSFLFYFKNICNNDLSLNCYELALCRKDSPCAPQNEVIMGEVICDIDGKNCANLEYYSNREKYYIINPDRICSQKKCPLFTEMIGEVYLKRNENGRFEYVDEKYYEPEKKIYFQDEDREERILFSIYTGMNYVDYLNLTGQSKSSPINKDIILKFDGYFTFCDTKAKHCKGRYISNVFFSEIHFFYVFINVFMLVISIALIITVIILIVLLFSLVVSNFPN